MCSNGIARDIELSPEKIIENWVESKGLTTLNALNEDSLMNPNSHSNNDKD